MKNDAVWLRSVQTSLSGYRRMIEAATAQLDDAQFFQRPQPGMHSVAILLRHLGGNLKSRWTNFLTEDGEKPNRGRDREFEDWTGSREELIVHFDAGWQQLCNSLDALSDDDLNQTVTIRGEEHSVPDAILRSLMHIAYHTGQIVLIARLVHGDDATWKWLTIPPGGSDEHNRNAWGSAASRSVFGKDPAPR